MFDNLGSKENEQRHNVKSRIRNILIECYYYFPPIHYSRMTTSRPLNPTELQEILGFTTDLARKAGALILEGSHAIQRGTGPGSVGEKKNAVDLVTEYDVRVEVLVRNEIARVYPHFQL